MGFPGALLKGYAAGLAGFAAVFSIVFLVSIAADNNMVVIVMIITASIGTILFLAGALNVLKKKL